MNRSKGSINWAKVENEVRLGQLSLREIAKNYDCSEGAIRYQMKKRGWTKGDLAPQVQDRIANETVKAIAGQDDGATDEELIQSAAKRIVDVVKIHRKTAEKHREQIEALGTVIDTLIARLTLQAKAEDGIDIKDVRELSTSLRNSTQSLERLVNIERKAFNIDADVDHDNAPDAININFYRKK